MNADRETPARPATTAPRMAVGLSIALLAGLFVVVLFAALRGAGLLAFDPEGEGRLRGLLAAIDMLAVLLAGWAAFRLLRIAGEVAALMAEQSRSAGRAAEVIEARLAPALARIAEALERPAAATPATVAPPAAVAPDRAALLADIRRVIAAGNWTDAERLARDFALDFPDDSAARRLSDEVHAGRAATVSGLRARLEAAREVRDPDRVIAIRDELAGHLEDDPRRELDREVVSWLMGLVRRGLAELPLRPDVVELATRVADRFDDTTEGASLRKSLPVLRRSVGLCPRCAKPYAGIESACPACLAGVTAPRLARIDEEAAPPEGPGESPADSVFSYPDSPFLDGERAD